MPMLKKLKQPCIFLFGLKFAGASNVYFCKKKLISLNLQYILHVNNTTNDFKNLSNFLMLHNVNKKNNLISCTKNVTIFSQNICVFVYCSVTYI